MRFAKVFGQIFNSSLASDWKARVVFQDFLVLADKDGIVDIPQDAIVRFSLEQFASRWNPAG